MSSQTRNSVLNSDFMKNLQLECDADNERRIRETEIIIAGMPKYRPARLPGIIMILTAFLSGFIFIPAEQSEFSTALMTMSTVLGNIGVVFLIVSFFQLPVPKAFKAEFKLTQRRYGRDPVSQALQFSVVVAAVWGLGVAVILGVNSLANGAGIPFMIIWSFIGMALGLAAFANLIRSFFIFSRYKKDFWAKFLAEVSSKVGADDD